MVRRYGISDITYGGCAFSEALAHAVAVHAHAVGTWENSLATTTVRSVTHARAQLDDAGLSVSNLVPTDNTIFPSALAPEPSDPQQRTDDLVRRIPILSTLRPESIVVLTGAPPDDIDVDEALDVCRTHLETLARCAAEHGTRLAIEPIHPSCASDWSMVTTAHDARRLATDVGSGAGILIDTWHVVDDPTLAATLADHPDIVVGVQVADWRSPRRRSRSWADRAFPGEGEGAMAVVDQLERCGFAGTYDVEIFSDDGRFGHALADSLWTLPADEIARRAVAALR